MPAAGPHLDRLILCVLHKSTGVDDDGIRLQAQPSSARSLLPRCAASTCRQRCCKQLSTACLHTHVRPSLPQQAHLVLSVGDLKAGAEQVAQQHLAIHSVLGAAQAAAGEPKAGSGALLRQESRRVRAAQAALLRLAGRRRRRRPCQSALTYLTMDTRSGLLPSSAVSGAAGWAACRRLGPRRLAVAAGATAASGRADTAVSIALLTCGQQRPGAMGGSGQGREYSRRIGASVFCIHPLK